MNLRFLFREMMHNRGQAAIFVLSVTLSLVSIVAVSSFRQDVRSALAGDAKILHGGDIIIRSQEDYSPSLQEELAALRRDEDVAILRTWEFYSMARRADGGASLFSNIKVVEKGYPLYGRVELGSGREFAEVLQPGRIIVGAALLGRLGVAVGDTLLLGDAKLTIADVVSRESLRPVDFFSFGPRIFAAAEDLGKMGLVGNGSRVSYVTLLKVATSPQPEVEKLAARLQAKAVEGRERVATAATAGSRVKRFFDNLLSFLALISVFTLLLAGIGMQSSLAALLRRKVKSFAIVRSLGATSFFLLRHSLVLVICLSLVGCTLGILAGLLVKQSLAGALGGFLPEHVALGVSAADVALGMALGLAVVSFFTFLPLSSTLDVKPAAIFRREGTGVARKITSRALIVLGILLLAGLVVWQLEEVRTGMYFIGGMLGLIAVIAVVIGALLAIMARLRLRLLPLRQAVRSLLRPGNATRAIVVTLSSALAVLLAIFLVEQNLRATYIDSYPADAPNLFCLDIQKDQRQGFLELVGEKVELFPVVRARLQAINGVKISREAELQKRGDSLAREFNLTYRETLLPDEILIKGKSLFGQGEGDLPPVSLLDTVVEMGDMEIGDILDFNIQGVPLRAQATSIRKHTRSMLYPYFYFVFPEKYLKAAPQTMFAALKVPEKEVAETENRIVSRYPNISPVNVGETAAELGRIMEKLSTVVTFFAAFSLLAGALILVSSILATRLARMEEAVYYKILGAGSAFVLRVFFLENLLLALLSGGCGLLVGQLGSWAVCHYLLEIEYLPHWPACLGLLTATVVIVVLLGLLSSITILRQKPARFLREQA